MMLSRGELISFPTETVYGLGANGLNPDAVKLIYDWKERPLSNPVILHGTSLNDLIRLVDVTSEEMCAMELLAKTFWPGPLTMVVKASAIVPKTVTAGGDYVAIRVPNDEVTLNLIRMCGFPLAGPSANKSGHTSPFSSEHVAHAFRDYNLTILADPTRGIKRLGIESTIAKIHIVNGVMCVTIVRPGMIGGSQIMEVLCNHITSASLSYLHRTVSSDEYQEAPGGLFRHYAPDIPAFIHVKNAAKHFCKQELANYIILSANGSLRELKRDCIAFLHLGCTIHDVAKNLYSMLRTAESVPGAVGIIISIINIPVDNDDVMKAIQDKLIRCSEGVNVCIHSLL